MSRASRLHIALLSALAITASAQAKPTPSTPTPRSARRAREAGRGRADDARDHDHHRRRQAPRRRRRSGCTASTRRSARPHAPLAEGASADERMAVARRRAAPRACCLESDHGERQLLADEGPHLEEVAKTATDAAAQHVADDRVARDVLEVARARQGRAPFRRVPARAQQGDAAPRRGIDLEKSRISAPVGQRTADGTVRYAGPIRGLDHGVILDSRRLPRRDRVKLAELTLPVGTAVAQGRSTRPRRAPPRLPRGPRRSSDPAACRSIPSRCCPRHDASSSKKLRRD